MTNLSDTRHVLISNGKKGAANVTMPVQEYVADVWIKAGWTIVKSADQMQSESDANAAAVASAESVGAPVKGAVATKATAGAVADTGDAGDQKI